MVTCPIYGKKNDDNWLVLLDNVIIEGGCQDCFEVQSDNSWWEEMERVGRLFR